MGVDGNVGLGVSHRWSNTPSLSGWRWVELQLTDGDEVAIGVAKAELSCPRVRIEVGLLFEMRGEISGASQTLLEVVDPDEEDEAIAGRAIVGARKRRMVVSTPLMDA